MGEVVTKNGIFFGIYHGLHPWYVYIYIIMKPLSRWNLDPSDLRGVNSPYVDGSFSGSKPAFIFLGFKIVLMDVSFSH